VLVGCLRNRVAVAALALSEAWGAEIDSVQVICAGNAYGATFSLDDAVTAGAIVQSMRQTPGFDARDGLPSLTDAAMAAEHLFASYASDPAVAFREGSHGRILQTLGFEADLDYCAALDRSSTVPYLSTEDSGLLVLRSRMVHSRTFD
jgi:phosphosulfolactate phosphohydrolase-like enzyme